MGERFRHFVAVDWSGAKGARHKGIAVAIADAAGGPPVLVRHHWSRVDVLCLLQDLPQDSLVGLDLGISLPFADCGAYFPGLDASPKCATSLWAMVERICADDLHLGAQSFVDHPDTAPYFRNGSTTGERFSCDGAQHGRGRFRVTEHAQEAMGCKPTSNFNLVGAAQVGKASLTGMRVLHALRGMLPVWPIDPLPDHGSVCVEIYTGLAALEAGRRPGASKMRTYEALGNALDTLGSPAIALTGPVDDHSSDALLTAAWLRTVAGQPDRWTPENLTPAVARTEGWTFGAL